MSEMKVCDMAGQLIEIGDHAILAQQNIEGSTEFTPVKVLQVEKDKYGEEVCYVELAHKRATNIDSPRLYVAPEELILTKTKVTF